MYETRGNGQKDSFVAFLLSMWHPNSAGDSFFSFIVFMLPAAPWRSICACAALVRIQEDFDALHEEKEILRRQVVAKGARYVAMSREQCSIVVVVGN